MPGHVGAVRGPELRAGLSMQHSVSTLLLLLIQSLHAEFKLERLLHL